MNQKTWVELPEELSYNLNSIKDEIKEYATQQPMSTINIDFSKVESIDTQGLFVLNEIINILKSYNTEYKFCDIANEINEVLEIIGIM